MREENRPPQTGPRCRNLRSKQIYMNLPFHPSGREEGETQEHSCLCFRTQQVFGPDGRAVSRGGCTAERPCYEAEAF